MAAPVVQENVARTQHENVQTVIDKEIHRDEYSTKVQPVQDTVVAPEVHKTQQAAVQHSTFEHGNQSDVEAKLAAESAKYKNTVTEAETQHTHSVAPVLVNEHVHEHHHQTIQPVIQREVIEPTVVDTVVPIKETHHEAAVHHGTTVAEPITASEFKNMSGTGSTGTSSGL